METLFETYVLDGGPLMVVLLLCSLVLLAIVIRDLIRFQPNRVLPPMLVKEGEGWRPDSNQTEVVQRVLADPSPLGRVMAHALQRRNERLLIDESPPPLSELVDEATELVADDLYEDLGPLSTIYTVAPLLGLLGTILGMMSAFREYASASDRDLSVLSDGIQQALVTTLWGLAISILAYIAARYFERRIRRFEREVLPPRATALLGNLTGIRPAGAGEGGAIAEAEGAPESSVVKLEAHRDSGGGAGDASSGSGDSTHDAGSSSAAGETPESEPAVTAKDPGRREP